ncbi:MAG TPA: RNA polymerase sigma factor [Candidatus Nanoarchaeia archaeon]|nr:RNA polymerase sigma factor [Candidatus Nanoarchaeia archaeon]
MDDPDLVARAKAGDEQAFEALLKPVYRTAYAMVAQRTSRQNAVDILQEAAWKAYRAIKKFDPEFGCFSTWLTTIARNLAIDRRRSDDRKTMSRLLYEPPSLDPPALESRGYAYLMCLANMLSPKQRETLLLDAEGLDSSEIGEITGTKPSTVRWRLHRARIALKERIAQTDPDLYERMSTPYKN